MREQGWSCRRRPGVSVTLERQRDRLQQALSLALLPGVLEQLRRQRDEPLPRDVAGDLPQLVLGDLREQVERGEIGRRAGEEVVTEEGRQGRVGEEHECLERRSRANLAVATALRHRAEHLDRRIEQIDAPTARDGLEPLEQPGTLIREVLESLVDRFQDGLDEQVQGVRVRPREHRPGARLICAGAPAEGQTPGGRREAPETWRADAHVDYGSVAEVVARGGEGGELFDRLVEELQHGLELPGLDRWLDAELEDPPGLHLEPQTLERLVRDGDLPARPGEAVPAHADREDQALTKGVVQRAP